MVKEAGRDASVSVERNGDWKVSTRDPIVAKRLRAMMRQSNKVMAERGEAIRSSRTRETLRGPDGKSFAIAEHLVDTVKDRGFVPVWRPGGLRCRRGPDGMFFRLLPRGWDPTGRTVLGLAEGPEPASPQRDPDGGVWVMVDGHWRLDTEL